MRDMTSKENGIAAIITGALAIIFGIIAMITLLPFFAGFAAGCGIWSLAFGIIALSNKN